MSKSIQAKQQKMQIKENFKMTLEYFNKQIHEELDGAKDYIERAIEAKIHHPSWASKFTAMADMEASHAANLMKMLEECIKHKYYDEPSPAEGMASSNTNPEEMYKDLMKHFGETMTYVENMKRGL